MCCGGRAARERSGQVLDINLVELETLRDRFETESPFCLQEEGGAKGDGWGEVQGPDRGGRAG